LKNKVPFILIVLIFNIACNNPFTTSSFKIKGNINSIKSGRAILSEMGFSNTKVVDTVEIENGKFEFEGNVREKGIYRISIDNGVNYFIILDNGSEIELSAATTNDKYTITGSAESEYINKFNNYLLASNQLITDFLDIQKQNNFNDSIDKAYKAESNLLVTQLFNGVRNFIDTCHSPLAALYAIAYLDPTKDYLTYNKLTLRLEKELPQSIYTKEFKELNNRFVDNIIGHPFKEIEYPDLKNRIIKLSALKGQWILLDFWASWCKPCRMDNPSLVNAYNLFKEKNFTIFSVSLDKNAGAWYDAVVKDKLAWPTHVSELKEWESSVCKDYGINQIPTNYLINPEGIIVEKDLHGEELIKVLKNYIK
jgi:thiol-disulfide isomerase/thioredoxin